MRVGKKWYSVEVVEAMLHRRDMGRTFYPEQCIRLGKVSNVTGRRFTKEELADTFWHEVTHAILEDMGRHTLNRDERFVSVEFLRNGKAMHWLFADDGEDYVVKH
jgi:hypothetical protein